MRPLILFCLVLFCPTKGDTQIDASLDSLKLSINPNNTPLEKTRILHNIGQIYYHNNRDSARKYMTGAYKIAKSIQDYEYLARTASTLAIMESVVDATTSTDYMIEALEAAEKSKDTIVLAFTFNAAGTHYRFLHELDLSIEYFQKAIPFYKQLNDDGGLSHVYNNMGISYMMLFKYDKGLEFWQKSLELKLKIGDKMGAATTLANIAIYYKDINRLDEAKSYVEQAVVLEKEFKDFERVGNSQNTLGDIYVKEKDYLEGIRRYKLALSYFDSSNTNHGRVDSQRGLYEAYEFLGDHKKALKHHKLYFNLTKDQFDESKSRISDEMKTKYETEKKEEENKLLLSQNELKDLRISEEEAKRELQSTQNLILTVCLVFAAISIFLVFVGYRKVKKDKRLVESKNEIIEEKNKEITDSIIYAKRLQSAILPSVEVVSSELNNFILYKPKDVVSGDFYWYEKKNGVQFIAAADCTGHGVPGAMVSVVCSNALNRSVNEFDLVKPSEILDKTRELVIETFSKSGENVKDGMDIALCAIKEESVSYAGANNPLWLVKNQQSEITEIKADKQPIGKFSMATPFQNHEFKRIKGDVIYLFTDGYADQFGGEKGKKLKYKPFKNLLLKHATLKLEEQSSKLDHFFTNWKGSLEQLDDVCVIGIRL